MTSPLPAGYTKFIDSMASGLVNLHTDAFKVMLLDTYTVGTTQDTAQYVADVMAVATEITGTGYAAGGQLLTATPGPFWSQSGSVWTFTCDDIVWDPSTFSAAFALFFDATPATTATQPVIGYWDFGGTLGPTTATPFTLAINTSGLFTFTNLS